MTSAPLVLLFDLDGTVYNGDLPCLAYARRVAERLPEAAATEFIGAVRTFLEATDPKVRAALPEYLHPAEDGYHAIAAAATAAGMDTATRLDAYAESRADVRQSAFAIEPVEGLTDWLADLGDRAHVVLATNAPEDGVAEILDAIGLVGMLDRAVFSAGKPEGMPPLVAELLELTTPDRLLAVGDRWNADLSETHRVGGRTAFVDRYLLGHGEPTWRATDLALMLPDLRAWARSALGAAA